jgi:hypothetical protein
LHVDGTDVDTPRAVDARALASVQEGINDEGYSFGVIAPKIIATRLTSPEGLREVHRYRESLAGIPELARRLRWMN